MRAIQPLWYKQSLTSPLFDEFDYLFERGLSARRRDSLNTRYDIEESDQYFLFSIDLPGFREDDISIEYKENHLTIQGEKKSDPVNEESRFLRGREFGQFFRKFRLPNTVNDQKIEAHYENGVLKVLLPKKEEVKARKISLVGSKDGFFTKLLKGAKEQES
ncbi:MAG: Hsp20/alpha crystallin family protein [Pseudomonadota bacterium]